MKITSHQSFINPPSICFNKRRNDSCDFFQSIERRERFLPRKVYERPKVNTINIVTSLSIQFFITLIQKQRISYQTVEREKNLRLVHIFMFVNSCLMKKGTLKLELNNFFPKKKKKLARSNLSVSFQACVLFSISIFVSLDKRRPCLDLTL